MSDFYDRLRALDDEYDELRADEQERRDRLEEHGPAPRTRATGDIPLHVTDAVPPGELYVIAYCRCMTDETAPPRESCPECGGTGVQAVRLVSVGDDEPPNPPHELRPEVRR